MGKRAVLLVAVLMVAAWAAPADAVVTITAQAASRPACGQLAAVTGRLTPGGTTPRVVLQRTVHGKWVDWKQPNPAGTPIRLTATPDDHLFKAPYTINYLAPTGGVLHLRVRSNGGGVVSQGFYVTPRC